MRKAICLIIAVASVFALVSGCSSGTPANETTSETPNKTIVENATTEAIKNVTLSLFHGKQEAQETFSEIIRLFTEKYPNIKLEQELVANEMNTVLRARIATGAMPDIVSAGVEVLDIAKGGYLVDLTEKEFMKNILPQTVKSLAFTDVNGKTWAMPVDGSFIGVFYNKKLLLDNGITVPKTISELKSVCEILKDKNIPAFALGYKDAWTAKMCALSIFSPAVYAKDLNWDLKKNEGTASFSDTPGWKVMCDLMKLIYTYGNKQTAFDTDYNGACSMFAQGKAAMMSQGLWALANVRAISPDLDIGVMGMPVSEDSADAKLHQFPDFSLGISSKSKNINEAEKFLEFMATKEIGQLWSEKTKLFSAVKGVDANFDPIVVDVNQLIAEGRTVAQGDRGWPSAFHADFEKAMPEFLLGQKDMNATLDILDKAWVTARAAAQ